MSPMTCGIGIENDEEAGMNAIASGPPIRGYWNPNLEWFEYCRSISVGWWMPDEPYDLRNWYRK